MKHLRRRTTFHGVLSSVDLLEEELRTRNVLDDNASEGENGMLDSFLSTIRNSGSDLMATINNILRLNTLTNNDALSNPVDYSLESLEADVLEDMIKTYAKTQVGRLSIHFQHNPSCLLHSVKLNADILIELLKCLVRNAVDATSFGSISVFATLLVRQRTLTIDVMDTGSGIEKSNHERIFFPFEKTNPHARGAGLGLSLAVRMVSSLKGRLTLVSSEVGVGSHFRIEIPHCIVLTPVTPSRRTSMKLRHLLTSFHVFKTSTHYSHLFSHLEGHLQDQGFQKSDEPQGLVIITNYLEGSGATEYSQIAMLKGQHMVIVNCDTAAVSEATMCLTNALKPHLVQLLTGPFYSSRLDRMLSKADSAFAAGQRSISPSLHAGKRSPHTWDSDRPLIVTTPPLTHAVEISMPIYPSQDRCSAPVIALLVDDNNVNLRVLELYCKKRKILCHTAVNDGQAVAAYKHAHPRYTLVLMDLQMPECDGVEACKLIRAYEVDECLPRATVFMLTGQDSVVDRKSAFEAGVDDYYVKPTSMRQLDQAIARVFPSSHV